MDARKEPSLMNRINSPHLLLAKNYWHSHLKPHDFVIDMTCGNGHDTQFLLDLLPAGAVFSLDIQECALMKARELVGDVTQVKFIHQSHSEPISLTLPSPPSLIVYNLGYLPGGDKAITTQSKTTIESLNIAVEILGEKGALSITCYPGHEEGLRESQEILTWAKNLEPSKWHVCHHQWINRNRSPSLLWIVKNQ
jgi:hypothetical protein